MGISIDQLLGVESLGDLRQRLEQAVAPTRIVSGWATVELDRAESELAGGPAGAVPSPVEADDRILGARSRRVVRADGSEVLLLEPSTEGRLAAALARYGEGPIALYLVTDPGGVERARRGGLRLSTDSEGPLGRERLVLGGPSHGPFLLLVDG